MAIPPNSNVEYIRAALRVDREGNRIASAAVRASCAAGRGRTRGRPGVIGNALRKSTERLVHGLIVGALLLPVVAAAAARADDADFAKAKKCMNCHAIDEKRVGPPYRTVAARYANDQAAQARLARKIREGGSGAWGVVPMPSNPDVTQADADRLAHWVLMQK